MSEFKNYIESNLEYNKADKFDQALIRSVAENKAASLFETYEQDDINELVEMSIQATNTTSEAIKWILENIEYNEEKYEILKDGRGAGKTVEDIASKWNKSVEEIQSQIDKGKEVEKEHTSVEEVAERIAMDHLMELPDYYDKLEKMEAEGKAELGLDK